MPDNIKIIKDAADIVEVISRILPLKKKGKDWWAVCPFHADKDPSFSVVPAKQIFHCFGCKAHGDVITFWMKYHQVPFLEAARAIAGMYGLRFDSRPAPLEQKKRYPKLPRIPASWQPDDKPEPCEMWKAKAGRFIGWAYEQLMETPQQIEYLAGRGIKKETIVANGLGWCPGKRGRDLWRDRKTWGLPELLNDNGKKIRAFRIPIGLVIPCISRKGEVIKIRIRSAGHATSPYYFVPGGVNVCTVLNANRRAHIIVESELDAFLIAQEAGDIVSAVALGSVSARPDIWTASLLRKSLHIIISLDYDNAGAKAFKWWKDNFRCARWPVPQGKDPGEAWQRRVNIRAWVKAGLPEGLR